eukprot:scaffold94723_cov60-Phaeocystis_antarctica.AAC.4
MPSVGTCGRAVRSVEIVLRSDHTRALRDHATTRAGALRVRQPVREPRGSLAGGLAPLTPAAVSSSGRSDQRRGAGQRAD